MKRREFLKYAGLMGAGSVLPLAPSMQLFAAQDNYTGPLWITIEAQGGWDPTSFCDPKGYVDPTDPLRLNNYDKNNIITVGNFNVAPAPDRFAAGGDLYNKYIAPATGSSIKPLVSSVETFFNTHQQNLLVINGIDVKTLAHGDGQRHTWSGELGRGGFPNFGALVSGALAGNKPIPFLTNGGYSDGGGLVTPVRINGSGKDALAEIAYPNRSARGANPRSYFSNEVLNLIQQASASRLTDLDSAQNLPRIKTALAKLKASRVDNTILQKFVDSLEAKSLLPPSEFRSNRVYQMYSQGSVALSAYASGATAAAHITLGGFDTHSRHDENHYMRLMDLFEGIDAIINEAQNLGINDTIVVVGSEFGRTNKYNENANPNNVGKNHWPITSMMFIDSSGQRITGNRVIGSTTAEHKANTIDPITLNPLAAGGVRITPAHIHRALRKVAGVDTTIAASSDFFIPSSEDLNLFT
ncbi:hypothetical protein MNBD_GAMMA22-960 [hydrothermal vent metagenome]|uniref:Tat (Twin-arginine translocation) pathway signal sequence domain protein n=1 Tax=hydrothermal vent metagenome TaxID=652676 RepID=A0A3B1A5A6_9ZZZZ